MTKESANLESRIASACDYYLNRDLLSWWSHPGPRVLFVGRGHCRATGVAPPDYVFALGRGLTQDGGMAGLLGMFEAKTTQEKSVLHLTGDRKARLHQWQQMHDAWQATGLDHFGYLVEWRVSDALLWYPISEVEPVTLFPPKLTFEQERGHPVGYLRSVGSTVPDWLNTILSWVVIND
jgi:hypothetical protein